MKSSTLRNITDIETQTDAVTLQVTSPQRVLGQLGTSEVSCGNPLQALTGGSLKNG
jgi:hypothetical protein